MHPALQTHNIQRLPVTYRRIATRACRSDHSDEDIQNVLDLLRTDVLSDEQQVLLIPVLWKVLDVVGDVPTPDEMEQRHPHTRTRIRRAVMALSGYYDIQRRPLSLGPVMWPRLWPWYALIYRYARILGLDSTAESEFLGNFVILWGSYHKDAATYSLMRATPGFRTLLAKTWSYLPHIMDSRPAALEQILHELCGFIADSAVTEVAHLDEMIEGSGGGIEDLASLVVQFLHVMEQRPVPETLHAGGNAYFLQGLIQFVGSTDPASLTKEEAETESAPLGRFCRALLAQGFVPALVSATTYVARASTTLPANRAGNTEAALSQSIILLRVLVGLGGRLSLESAIEAGLLRTILICATLSIPVDLSTPLHRLVSEVLHENLVYYHVIALLKGAMSDTVDLWSTEEFRKSRFFADWEVFSACLNKHVGIFEDMSTPPCAACDNLECGVILDRSQFRRCAGCKSFYYCSPACQSIDWKQGGHRRLCGSKTGLILTEGVVEGPLVRERHFMRALVDHDYHAEVAEIYKKHVQVMADDPDGGPVLTFFNYTVTPYTISVHSLRDWAVTGFDKEERQEWDHLVQRAISSRGRFQIHIIKVPEIHKPRMWIVPLRASSDKLQEELRQHATRLPRRKKRMDLFLAGQVQIILQRNQDVVEIH
ncbi:hypothetical protein C8R43DRAFT_966604 [Mycena crocata]|nr:hypothetical protein C8R43DRAFT_966604 [Mycena crocata]